jgi:hypothetical protein
MNEHLHKVFPLHVKELGDGEGPVEGEGEHVVPPHVRVQLVVGIVIPSTQTQTPTSEVCSSVFRIRDILVRIQILGSVPLTNGFGCGSLVIDFCIRSI